jgi:hypothetical protein
MSASFDFPAFRAAYAARDLAAWVGFYADDAEWIEYLPDLPSCHRRTVGRAAIAEFLSAAATWPELIAVEEPEIDGDRVRFLVRVGHADGRRMIDLVMLAVEAGRIVRQVDVEAWD